VRDALASVEFSEPGFDFGQEHQPLNSVVKRSVRRQRLDGLEYLLATAWLGHT